MIICLFPELKIGTTFPMLKMDGNIPNSKAWLKLYDKIGTRISPTIRKKKEEILMEFFMRRLWVAVGSLLFPLLSVQ